MGRRAKPEEVTAKLREIEIRLARGETAAAAAARAVGVTEQSYYRWRGIHPQTHLKDYTGFVHADGFAGFNALYEKPDVHEVACMAHIRRKFVDVVKASGSAVAEDTVRRIAELYAVEKEARGRPPDERVRLRQLKALSLIHI